MVVWSGNEIKIARGLVLYDEHHDAIGIEGLLDRRNCPAHGILGSAPLISRTISRPSRSLGAFVHCGSLGWRIARQAWAVSHFADLREISQCANWPESSSLSSKFHAAEFGSWADPMVAQSRRSGWSSQDNPKVDLSSHFSILAHTVPGYPTSTGQVTWPALLAGLKVTPHWQMRAIRFSGT